MVYLQLAWFMVSQVELLFYRRNMHFQLIIAAGCSRMQIYVAHPDLLECKVSCSALCVMHCALCIVHCALWIVHCCCAMCIVHCTLCIVHCAFFILQCALCSAVQCNAVKGCNAVSNLLLRALQQCSVAFPRSNAMLRPS